MRLYRTIALSFLATALTSCLSSEPPNHWNASMGTSPTGPQVDGIGLSLTANGSVAFQFAPIWVTVEFRNVSGVKPHVESSFYHAIITNRNGGWTVPFGPLRLSEPICGRSLNAGASRYNNLNLHKGNDFAMPGLYTVQVIAHLRVGLKGGPFPYPCKNVTLKSNVITITVL